MPHDGLGSNAYGSIGEMTFSPQGNRLVAVTMTGVVDVFDFDRCTGQLSNWLDLGTPRPTETGPDTYYGCSFSPDGSKVYASEVFNTWTANSLYQWDLTAADVPASKTLVYTAPPNVKLGQHQLGPDGKIYISHINEIDAQDASNFHLSVIPNPNVAGAACGFNYLGMDLQGRRTHLGLPNLPNYSLGPLLAQTAVAPPPGLPFGDSILICPGDSVQLGHADTTGGAVSYQWAGQGLDNPGTAQPTAGPGTSGWYYLTVTDPAFGSCGLTTDSVRVVVAGIVDFPVADAGRDTTVCTLDSLGLGGAEAGWDYSWTPSAGLSHPDSSWTGVLLPGAYVLEARNPLAYTGAGLSEGAGACLSARDTVRVDTFAWNPLPVGFAGPDTLTCLGDSVALGVQETGWIWDWRPAAGLAEGGAGSTMASPGATTDYVLIALDSASGGMCHVNSDTVHVAVEEPFVHAIPESRAFCPGEVLEIGVPSEPGYSYLWQPIEWLQSPQQAQTLANPPSAMVYTLIVRSDTHTTAHCREQRFTVALGTDGCPMQNILSPNADGINDLLDLGTFAQAPVLEVYDRWGTLIYSSQAYQNDWDGGNAPDGVYWYVVAPQAPEGRTVVALVLMR